MTLPLYLSAIQDPPARTAEGNAGLWFDKFCNTWRHEHGTWTMSASKNDTAGHGPKLQWLQGLEGQVGNRAMLDEAASRLGRLVGAHEGRMAIFRTVTRFATGLGRSHPIENGFAWHPTLGTPYLPGSSLKGLVGAWAREGADPKPCDDEVARLLGDRGKVGSICFLDAIPVAPVRVEADVMTPHYGGWDPDDPPGDWRSPTPIHFLTTAADARFLFGVLPWRPIAEKDVQTTFTWMCEALEWLGGGAKTATGYGRFELDEPQTASFKRRLEETSARQELLDAPGGRWLLEFRGKTELQILEMVRVQLGNGGLTDPTERQAFAEAVPADMVVLWKVGKAKDKWTKLSSDKLKERARQVEQARRGGDGGQPT